MHHAHTRERHGLFLSHVTFKAIDGGRYRTSDQCGWQYKCKEAC
jgi:hypothetical protein